ncbi:MAG: hypothetical protein HUJ54_12640, partial [Erysipelotrichaceae bacterium]|nr:hypothetical protein [Erysipelotrichaceae bacterium]
NTNFYLSTKLDNTRINRNIQTLVEEVISHLQSVENAEVEIRLEVNVHAPKGIESNVVRTVSENCQTLKVDDFEFND